MLWKDDLVLFMSAIMHELGEAGLHMYLLIEVQLSNQYACEKELIVSALQGINKH